MDWDTIWKAALAVITAAGGYGALALLVIKFSSGFIAEKLQKKYELKLSKELEEYKSTLDAKLEKHKSFLEGKTYITKTKFDTEFNIFRELSAAFFELNISVNTLIPYGFTTVLADEEKRKEIDNENYMKLVNSIVKAQNILYQNIPFIPKRFVAMYQEILKLCIMQKNRFQERWNVLDFDPQKDRLKSEDYIRSKTIDEKLMTLNENVRDYLDSLDVLD
ncbi:hypothetical protein SAMN02910436_02436 [Ruminococcaceae bacterium P7]|nr:hypothetical protein SAMN02910436_02436 [Ruminococcaceae bacterium P7]